MWALRTSANQVKNCSVRVNALRSAATLLGSYKCIEVPLGEESNHERSFQAQGYSMERNTAFVVYPGIARRFASQVKGSTQNKKENKDEEEGFSDLDVPPHEASMLDSDIADKALALDSEVSEGEAHIDSDLSDADVEGDGPSKGLLEDIIHCTYKDVPAKIDKWVADDNYFNRETAMTIVRQLKRRKMYGRALQVSNWLLENKSSAFEGKDHAIQLDLIFRQYGITRAEHHFQTIPSEKRGYRVHQTRLVNFTRSNNVKKAEEVFNEMKNAGFTLYAFDYNALLQLYLQNDRSKISNLLKMMEDESIKPDAITYHYLIRDKSIVGDIVEIEKILETMKAEGIQPDQPATLAELASSYIRAGHFEKAEALMKELEDDTTAKEKGYRLKILVSLYADIGKPSDVERVWNAITSLPKILNSYYIAGIRAWGKLGEIEKAERIFEKIMNSGRNVVPPIAYNALLDVYLDHNLFLKAKEYVTRMSDNSRILLLPSSCEAIVKTYLKSGDLEKADAFLLEICRRKQIKPYYRTFILILEKYAEKGDIANAEKIFDSLVNCGYRGRMHSYECLLQAYLKAHSPAYGFKERMLAANLRPNKNISNILLQVNAFKKEHLQSNSLNLLD